MTGFCRNTGRLIRNLDATIRIINGVIAAVDHADVLAHFDFIADSRLFLKF